MTRKRAIIFAASATAIAAGLILLWLAMVADPPPSPPQRLGDHEITLTLTRVRQGKKAEFLNGTFREKFLDFLLPSNGLNFASHKFRPPNKAVRLAAADDGALFIEFKLDSPPGLIYTGTSQGAMRLIAVNQPNANPLVATQSARRVVTGRSPPAAPWNPGGATPSANINVSNVPGSLAFDGGNLSLGTRASPRFSSATSEAVSLPAGRGSMPASAHAGIPFATESAPIALVQYSGPARPTTGSWLVGSSNDFRMSLIGDDGFEFVEPFWPQLARVINGYIYIRPTVYPRQSRNLALRIEERDRRTAPWQTIASFQTRIQPQPVKSWAAEQTPVRKLHGDVELVVDEVTVVESTFHDGSKYETLISYHLRQDNVPQSEWKLISLSGEDAGGISGTFTTATTSSEDGLITESPQVLNPNQVWHLKAVFRRKGAMPDMNFYPFEFFVQPVNKIGKK